MPGRSCCMLGLAILSALLPARLSAQPAPPPNCFAASAQGTVRLYYRALNRHQAAAARSCLTQHFRAWAERTVDPDWENVLSARIVSLTARPVSDRLLPAGIGQPPARTVQVGAQVVMRYRRLEGAPNGLNIWFIYVIKQRATSPWRIAAIGSGP